MHSSRMSTARLLTVCLLRSGLLLAGGGGLSPGRGGGGGGASFPMVLWGGRLPLVNITMLHTSYAGGNKNDPSLVEKMLKL